MDNNFIKSLKVASDISQQLRSEIIAILKKEKTINEVCASHKGTKDFPQDPKGIKRTIERLTKEDEEIAALYREYKAKKNKRPRSYNYIPEFIYMLETDISQRALGIKFGIPRETLKDAIKRIKDPDLAELIQKHSSRHELGRNCPGVSIEEKRGLEAYKQKYYREQNEQEERN